MKGLATIDQLALVIENIADAVVFTDLDGRVTLWNRGAERMSGYGRDEMLGRSVGRLTPPESRDGSAEIKRRLLTGEEVVCVRQLGNRKGGARFDSEVTGMAIRDPGGAVTGFATITRDVTESVAFERQLAATAERFQSLFQHASEAAFILDERGKISHVSASAERLFGMTVDDFHAAPGGWAFVDPEHRPAVAARLQACVQHPGERITVELPGYRTPSGPRWLEATVTNLLDDPNVRGIVANVRDVTDRKEAELALAASEARFRGHFEHAAVGQALTTIDGGRFVEVNAAFCTMTGYSHDELLGMSYMDVVRSEPERSITNWCLFEQLLRGEISSYQSDERYVTRDGADTFISNSVSVVRDAAGTPRFVTSTVQDITERNRMARELEHLALHDSLTGLPNRSLLHDRLERAIARAERSHGTVTVVFIDVDQFKAVNDSRGHSAGDELLRAIARRLSDALRDADTIARFGGDEFVVVCDNLAGQAGAVGVGQRIVAAFDAPIALSGGDVFATVSGGIAIGGATSSPEELLRCADTAMYRAKSHGRARVELYDATSPTDAEQRLSMIAGLHRALDGELFVEYQPIVDMVEGSVVSVEALVRWNHPVHGLLGPDAFIPLAEETGLVSRLGEFVLRDACAHIGPWRALAPELAVAVNVSGRQLADPQFVDLVSRVLGESGAPPRSLCLEVTETVAMDDVDQLVAVLEALHHRGVRLAIDDLGTGYSSLRNLRRLPVDAVKIDREFVDGLPTDPHDTAIVAAMIAMARALGLVVVAEGVETVEQHDALRELGCMFAQGFRYARPMTADALERLLANGARGRSLGRAGRGGGRELQC